jgi:hypothetical protein
MKARFDRSDTFMPRMRRGGQGESGRIHVGYKHGRPSSTRHFVQKYMADEGRNVLFDAYDREPPTQAFIILAENDPSQHLLLFSPAPGQSLDLQVLTRELMRGLAEDHGQAPDWIAAVHRNSASAIHHAHVLVRGRDQEGQTLNITPGYVHGPLRERAEAVARELMAESRGRERYSVELPHAYLMLERERDHGRGEIER